MSVHRDNHRYKLWGKNADLSALEQIQGGPLKYFKTSTHCLGTFQTPYERYIESHDFSLQILRHFDKKVKKRNVLYALQLKTMFHFLSVAYSGIDCTWFL